MREREREGESERETERERERKRERERVREVQYCNFYKDTIELLYNLICCGTLY